MSVLSFPDIVGMLVLVSVLAVFRNRNRDERVDGWLIGLVLILVEMIAASIIHGSGLLPELTQTVQLDAYLLAAVAFGWAARRDLLPSTEYLPFYLLPALPLFVLATIFGMGVTVVMPYVWINGASVAVGLVYLLFFSKVSPRNRTLLVAVHLLIWVPMLVLSAIGDVHRVVYWGLACLYVLVAISFRPRRQSPLIGTWVIAGAFVIWAACFLAYPAVQGNVFRLNMVEQIWNLQKFFAVIGMLLVLLEEETQRRREEAMHDALTGLPNRRLFEDRLEQAIERSRRSGLSAAVFAIDLNGFKAINDTLGHHTGDVVLMRVADRLKRSIRGADTVARCGGDEFLVIVNDLARAESCAHIAQTLRIGIEAVTIPGHDKTADKPLKLGGSIGFALYPEDAADEAALCQLADQRMYDEKQAGTAVPAAATTPVKA